MFPFLIQTAASSEDDGLTFSDIMADIPHDAGAIVIYILLALALFAVFYYGVRSNESRDETSNAPRDGEDS